MLRILRQLSVLKRFKAIWNRLVVARKRRQFRIALFETLDRREVMTGVPFELVRDINANTANAEVRNLANVDGVVYFSANNGTTGSELWRTDTSQGAVQVKDIRLGSASSNPNQFTNVNGTVYFVANNGTHGSEIWRTDSSQGAVRVTDINSGDGHSMPKNLVNLAGSLIFVATDDVGETSLYKKTGSSAPTVLMGGLSNANNLTEANGFVYFTIDSDTVGNELWRTNGTIAGTALFDDIRSGADYGDIPYSSTPENLVNVNGVLYFSASNDIDVNLFRVTATGSQAELVEVYPPDPETNDWISSDPDALTNVNGALFFSATNGESPRELWQVPSSPNATSTASKVSFKSHLTGAVSDKSPMHLANVNGKLYFQTTATPVPADSSVPSVPAPFDLHWLSDGTSGGTVPMTAFDVLDSGFSSSNDFEFIVANNSLYVPYSDGKSGTELWRMNVDSIPFGVAKSKTLDGFSEQILNPTDFGILDPMSGVHSVRLVTLPDAIDGQVRLYDDGGAAFEIVSPGTSIPYAKIAGSQLRHKPSGSIESLPTVPLGFQLQNINATSPSNPLLDPTPRSLVFSFIPDSKPLTENFSRVIDTNAIYQFKKSDFPFSDPGNAVPNEIDAIRLIGWRSQLNRELFLDNVPIVLPVESGVMDEYIATDWILAQSIQRLQFRPSSGVSAASFGFDIRDTGSTLFGGENISTPATFSYSVQGVNQPPDGRNAVFEISEDVPYVLREEDFGFRDEHDIPRNAFKSVVITTVPSSNDGDLLFDGDLVAPGDEIDVHGGIDQSRLTFLPRENRNGDGLGRFTFQVRDDGIEAIGSPLDPVANFAYFNIASVNDAPRGYGKTMSVVQGTTLSFEPSDFGFEDLIDGNQFRGVRIAQLPPEEHGSLRLFGARVRTGQEIPVDSITHLTFSPSNKARDDYETEFRFAVLDDGGTNQGGLNYDQTARAISLAVETSDLTRAPGRSAIANLVSDINSGDSSSDPRWLTNVNGTLYFSASDGQYGEELFKSNGTRGGTTLVKDISVDGSSHPSWLTNVNGNLFFVTEIPEGGSQLWKSDGTDSGTVLVGSFPADSGQPSLAWLTNFNGQLYFTAYTYSWGTELWRLDSVSNSLDLVADIDPDESSNPTELVVVDDTLYFAATTASNGNELWSHQKNQQGAFLVADLTPNQSYYYSEDRTITRPTFDYYGYLSGYEEYTYPVSGYRTRIGSGSPRGLTNSNGTLFFAAETPAQGRELWKVADQGPELVYDTLPFNRIISPGLSLPVNSGSPDQLTNVDGVLFFSAESSSGRDLWKSDGTGTGTLKVKSITAPPSGTSTFGNSFNPGALRNVNGLLYFTARTPGQGQNIWVSDGTSAGTRPLPPEENPGFGSTLPADLLEIDETFYFPRLQSGTGQELWKIVPNHAPRGLGRSVTISHDTPYKFSTKDFVVDDWHDSNALMSVIIDSLPEEAKGKLTITIAGKMRPVLVNDEIFVRDIDSLRFEPSSTYERNSMAFFRFRVRDDGGRLLGGEDLDQIADSFVINISKSGNSQPVNDNPAVTLVKDIFGGISGSDPKWFTDVSGTLYFVATDPVAGRELWRTDGTTLGTFRVRDLKWNGSSNPSNLLNANGTLFFMTQRQSGGSDLWRTDGTSIGTNRVFEFPFYYDFSAIDSLTNLNDKLIFSAYTQQYGTELWISDGTTNGTHLLKNISLESGSNPSEFTQVGNRLYFAATSDTNGRELWTSDGTIDGTFMVDDLRGNWGEPRYGYETRYDPEIGYFDYPISYEVTVIGDSNPSDLTNVNGTLFFTAYSKQNGRELWKVSPNNTPSSLEIELVADINPTGDDENYPFSESSNPSSLTNVGGTLFFAAETLENGRELWASNGFASGTFLAADLNGIDTYDPDGRLVIGSSNPSELFNVNGTLHFNAFDLDNGLAICTAKPVAGSLQVIAGRLSNDRNPGFGQIFPSHFLSVQGTHYFTLANSEYGNELYRFDTNQAPNGVDQSRSILNTQPHSLSIADFTYTDTPANPNRRLLSIKLTNLPVGTSGRLQIVLSGDNFRDVTEGEVVNEHQLSTLRYVPNATALQDYTASFRFAVRDAEGTFLDGKDIDASPANFTFHVKAVNQAPVGFHETRTLARTSIPYQFSITDFRLQGVQSNPANQLKSIRIESLPTTTINGVTSLAGVLKLRELSGSMEYVENEIPLGREISANEIPNLRFYPTLSRSKSSFNVTFSFRVRDRGGVLDGGKDLAFQSNSFTFNIPANTTPNTAPDFSTLRYRETDLLFTPRITVLEDQLSEPLVLEIQDDDTLEPEWKFTFTSSNPSLLAADRIAVVDRPSFDTPESSPANVTPDGKIRVRFLPYANQTGTSVITISVSDGLHVTTRSVTVTVVPVNDPPFAYGDVKAIENYPSTPVAIRWEDFHYQDIDEIYDPVLTLVVPPSVELYNIADQTAPLPLSGSLELGADPSDPQSTSVVLAAGSQVSRAQIVRRGLTYVPASIATPPRHVSFVFKIEDEQSSTIPTKLSIFYKLDNNDKRLGFADPPIREIARNAKTLLDYTFEFQADFFFREKPTTIGPPNPEDFDRVFVEFYKGEEAPDENTTPDAVEEITERFRKYVYDPGFLPRELNLGPDEAGFQLYYRLKVNDLPVASPKTKQEWRYWNEKASPVTESDLVLRPKMILVSALDPSKPAYIDHFRVGLDGLISNEDNVVVEFHHGSETPADSDPPIGSVRIFAPSRSLFYRPSDFDPSFTDREGLTTIYYRLVRNGVIEDLDTTSDSTWRSYEFNQATYPSLTASIEDADFEPIAPALSSDLSPVGWFRGIVREPGPIEENDSSSVGSFTVDLRLGTDPLAPKQTFTTDAKGEFVVRLDQLPSDKVVTYRVRRFEDESGEVRTPWKTLTVTFKPVSLPNDLIIELKSPLADAMLNQLVATTYDSTIKGRLTLSSDSNVSVYVELTINNSPEPTRILVDENGHFEYSVRPALLGSNAVLARVTAFDSVSGNWLYASDSIGTALTWGLDFELLSRPVPAFQLSLHSDDGASNQDRRSSNVKLDGLIDSLDDAADSFDRYSVEFFIGSDTQVVAVRKPDSLGRFTYTPPISADDQTSVTINARLIRWNPFFKGYEHSSTSIEITRLSRVSQPIAISNMRLTEDNGANSTDHRSSRITIQGAVGQGSYSTTSRIRWSHSIEGNVEGDFFTDSRGKFQFSPSGLTPNVSQTVYLQASHYEPRIRQIVSSDWVPFEFTYEPTTNQPPLTTQLRLISDTGLEGDFTTLNPTIFGQVSNDGSASRLPIEIDLDGNDGLDRADVTIFTDPQGTFLYTPIYSTFGSKTVKVRAVEFSQANGSEIVGAWTSLAFVLQTASNNEPVVIRDVTFDDLAIDSESRLQSPTLYGRITNDQQLDGHFVEVDLDGNDVSTDWTTTTDRQGRFRLPLTGLPEGSFTLSVRIREFDNVTRKWIIGSDFVYSDVHVDQSAIAVNVPTLQLTNDDGESASDRITTDPRLMGNVDRSDHPGNAFVELDFDSDFTADLLLRVQSNGTWSFPGNGLLPSSSNIQVSARTRIEANAGELHFSPWSSEPNGLPFSFTLLPSANPSLAITDLVLENDTGSSATNDRSTSIPRIRGTVVGASTSSTTNVSYDLDGDGSVDGSTVVNNGQFIVQLDTAKLGNQRLLSVDFAPSIGSQSPGSGWKRFSFVYSTDPDGPAAQQLVDLMELVEQSQLETTLNGTNARINRLNIDRQSDRVLDTQSSSANAQRNAAIRQAESQVKAAQLEAQSDLQAALVVAGYAFQSSLATFPGDTQSYNFQAFSLPDLPDYGLAVIPDDSTQPKLRLAIPTYSGPTLDIEQDETFLDLRQAARDELEGIERSSKELKEEKDRDVQLAFSNQVNLADRRRKEAFRLADLAYTKALSETIPDEYSEKLRVYREKSNQAWNDATEVAWKLFNDVWTRDGLLYHNEDYYNFLASLSVYQGRCSELGYCNDTPATGLFERLVLTHGHLVAHQTVEPLITNRTADAEKRFEMDSLNTHRDVISVFAQMWNATNSEYAIALNSIPEHHLKIFLRQIAATIDRLYAKAEADKVFREFVAIEKNTRDAKVVEHEHERNQAVANAQRNLDMKIVDGKKAALDVWLVKERESLGGSSNWLDYQEKLIVRGHLRDETVANADDIYRQSSVEERYKRDKQVVQLQFSRDKDVSKTIDDHDLLRIGGQESYLRSQASIRIGNEYSLNAAQANLRKKQIAARKEYEDSYLTAAKDFVGLRIELRRGFELEESAAWQDSGDITKLILPSSVLSSSFEAYFRDESSATNAFKLATNVDRISKYHGDVGDALDRAHLSISDQAFTHDKGLSENLHNTQASIASLDSEQTVEIADLDRKLAHDVADADFRLAQDVSAKNRVRADVSNKAIQDAEVENAIAQSEYLHDESFDYYLATIDELQFINTPWSQYQINLAHSEFTRASREGIIAIDLAKDMRTANLRSSRALSKAGKDLSDKQEKSNRDYSYEIADAKYIYAAGDAHFQLIADHARAEASFETALARTRRDMRNEDFLHGSGLWNESQKSGYNGLRFFLNRELNGAYAKANNETGTFLLKSFSHLTLKLNDHYNNNKNLLNRDDPLVMFSGDLGPAVEEYVRNHPTNDNPVSKIEADHQEKLDQANELDQIPQLAESFRSSVEMSRIFRELDYWDEKRQDEFDGKMSVVHLDYAKDVFGAETGFADRRLKQKSGFALARAIASVRLASEQLDADLDYGRESLNAQKNLDVEKV